MIYKKYGKTGLDVSAVGFGGMRFDMQHSLEENAKIVRYAYDKGITYFDTAPGYNDGQSEVIFGMALKELAGQRDSFYVSTKGMPTSFDTADKAVAAVEASLQKLQMDKIDFYHVWCIRALDQYELAMKPGGQYDGLLKCKERGLIDHIVISTHLKGDQACQCLVKGEFEGVLLGANIINFPYRWAAVQQAYDMGLGVVAMNPLAGGMIPLHRDRFAFLCEGDETPTEAALRFCIGCPQITVTLNGFTTCEHIDTACKVADHARPFAPEDIERIRRSVSERMDEICTGCGYCIPECVANVPIASYMQFYNEKQINNLSDEEMASKIPFQQQFGLLVDLPASAADCVACGKCEDACTQHLKIVERLREIAGWEQASAKNAQGQDQ